MRGEEKVTKAIDRDRERERTSANTIDTLQFIANLLPVLISYKITVQESEKKKERERQNKKTLYFLSPQKRSFRLEEINI